jgi:hypothetical protein
MVETKNLSIFPVAFYIFCVFVLWFEKEEKRFIKLLFACYFCVIAAGFLRRDNIIDRQNKNGFFGPKADALIDLV